MTAQTRVFGTVSPGFEPVYDAFLANFSEYDDLGAAFAVSHRGQPVVDLWGGVADQTTARSLARLYGCLAAGGEIEGIRLISPETLARGRRELTRRRDPLIDELMAFGIGFRLQTEPRALMKATHRVVTH